MKLGRWLALLACCLLGSMALAGEFAAQVRTKEAGTEVPVYATVQAAIDAAPDTATRAYRIYLPAGKFYEKLVVNKPRIQLVGQGLGKTLLTYDDFAGKPRPGETKGMGTTGSASITVTAPYFAASDLTIANGFDYPTMAALPDGHPDKVHGMQAVALKLADGSDKARFERVTLEGYQDTLYTDVGSAMFSDCTVKGHIDFIFGAGQAWFEKCRIVSRARAGKGEYSSYVTAASTQLSHSQGLVFNHCRFEREAGVQDQSVALGRPWHPTRTFDDGRYADPNAVAHVVIMNSYLDAHIHPKGWTSMGGTTKEGGKRPFLPQDARFFEYNNSGPGALRNNHRRQLAGDVLPVKPEF